MCVSAARPTPTAGAAPAAGPVQQDQQELQKPPDVCLCTRYGFAKPWSSLAQTLTSICTHSCQVLVQLKPQTLYYDPSALSCGCQTLLSTLRLRNLGCQDLRFRLSGFSCRQHCHGHHSTINTTPVTSAASADSAVHYRLHTV